MKAHIYQKMEKEQLKIHPEFSVNGIQCDAHTLFEVGYSFIKEGEEFERPIGDFLLDWLSPTPSIITKTSGSTGSPRNIELTKSAMVQSARATADFFGLQSGCRALLCLPADHIAGKMMLVRAMIMGWKLEIVPPSTTPLFGLSTSFDFCAMVPMQLRKSISDLHMIKTLIVGGAPLQVDLINAVKTTKTRIYETYGMTETASHIALKPVQLPEEPNADADSGIFNTLKGVSVSQDNRGCLLIEAPWLIEQQVTTNDLVELISPKQFKWLGRWDNVINSGGIKLIPEIIEKKLEVVIDQRFVLAGLPDKVLGEKLVMLIEGSARDTSLSFDFNKIKGLHPYEIPKEIQLLDRFPETLNGKIDRHQILKLLPGKKLNL